MEDEKLRAARVAAQHHVSLNEEVGAEAYQISDDGDTESVAFIREIMQATVETIRKMEPWHARAVILLHYAYDMDLNGIAKILNLPAHRVGQLHVEAVLAVHAAQLKVAAEHS